MKRRIALFATSVAVVTGLMVGATVVTAGSSEAQEAPATEEEAPRRHGRGGLAAAAEAIGIDPQELGQALRDGQTIAEVAEANGASADAVVDAMVTALGEKLAEAVEAGRLTQEEADEKLANAEERIEGIVDGTIEPPFRRGPRAISGAAELIGIEPQDLFQALRDGQTLGEVAEANGMSSDELVDEMVAAATERISQAVADGRLTQEEADEKLTDLEEKIQGIVDGTADRPFGRRGPGRGGPGFGPGVGGPSPFDTDTAA